MRAGRESGAPSAASPDRRQSRPSPGGGPRRAANRRLVAAPVRGALVPERLVKVIRMRRLQRLLADERGQDIVEYGVLAAFISVAAVATIRTIGPLVAALWTGIIAALQ